MSVKNDYSRKNTYKTNGKIGRFVVWSVVVVVLMAGSLVFLLRGKNTHFSDEIPARLAARGEKIPFLIKNRNNPLYLKPVLGLENCVTDEQILLSLNASLPQWHPPSVPSLVHELKLWGKDCIFTKEQVGGEGRTGKMMVETLLNDSLCAEQTVKLGDGNGGTYLMDSPFGIHPIQSGSYDAVEYRGEPHYGKLTMLMALSDVPISTPVTTSSGYVGTLADILQDTIMNFHWGQELEFIGCSLAFWLPPEKSWTNQFDEKFTFDDLMKHLLEPPLGKGCCGGCHVPYTVVTILRIDSEYSPILSPKTRQQAEQWIKNVAKIIETNQLPDGTWERDWGKTEQKGFLYGDKTLDAITLLGHHLEWIAIANEAWRPSKDCVNKAVIAVSEQIGSLPELRYRSFKTVLPCSHAAKAMCLMRNIDPYQFWLSQ
ncbi:MAG: hypothetical protein LBG58_00125 [Planctomycetaceae bacterium]|jgi:hypothetical protein|nr:hypothetical protein [Planctomycetaceae bacterium]